LSGIILEKNDSDKTIWERTLLQLPDRIQFQDFISNIELIRDKNVDKLKIMEFNEDLLKILDILQRSFDIL